MEYNECLHLPIFILKTRFRTTQNVHPLGTHPFVDLLCLRVLHISSGVGALTTVRRHITFPPSVILDLSCEENQSTQIESSNFLSVSTTKFLSSLVIQQLSLHYDSEGNTIENLDYNFGD